MMTIKQLKLVRLFGPSVQKFYKKMEQHANILPDYSLVMARECLFAIIADLNTEEFEPKSSIFDNIEALGDTGLYSFEIINLMHSIRKTSNKAAHQYNQNVDSGNAKQVHELVNRLLLKVAIQKKLISDDINSVEKSTSLSPSDRLSSFYFDGKRNEDDIKELINDLCIQATASLEIDWFLFSTAGHLVSAYKSKYPQIELEYALSLMYVFETRAKVKKIFDVAWPKLIKFCEQGSELACTLVASLAPKLEVKLAASTIKSLFTQFDKMLVGETTFQSHVAILCLMPDIRVIEIAEASKLYKQSIVENKILKLYRLFPYEHNMRVDCLMTVITAKFALMQIKVDKLFLDKCFTELDELVKDNRLTLDAVEGMRDTYKHYLDTYSVKTRLTTKIDRNSLCPCNSGKKYKKCCLQ